MDPADYRELVELLEEQLRDVGAGELVDIALYATRGAHTGDLRPVSPKKHAIAMLEAFDRYLSIRDQHTFSTALARINEALAESAVEDAAFVPLSEALSDWSFSLSATPDLSAVRKDLRVFIHQLHEDGDPPEPTD